MPETSNIVLAHIRLSVNLFLRFGAPLSAIWMGSYLLNILLLRGAVEIGLLSRFAGLIALAPIILLQLVAFAAMFLVLRDGLPLLRRRKRVAAAEAGEDEGDMTAASSPAPCWPSSSPSTAITQAGASSRTRCVTIRSSSWTPR